MIEIIQDKERWDDFIMAYRSADFYHTYDYHVVAKGNGKPVLLKYSHGQDCIGLPLLIRRIPDTEFYDATSVYGYPGPLCDDLTVYFDSKHFTRELLDFFLKNRIVSVFSRMNPYTPLQLKVFESLGKIEKKGVIVSIDLEQDVDQQRKQFGRRLKGQLNKIRRHCYVKEATSRKDIQEFIRIYHENMDRVNAKPMYYFDDHYFRVLSNICSFNT